MGFCDAVPGADKALRVLYYYRSQPHAATFLDLVGPQSCLCAGEISAMLEAFPANSASSYNIGTMECSTVTAVIAFMSSID